MYLTFITLTRDFEGNSLKKINVTTIPLEKETDKLLFIPKDKVGEHSQYRYKLFKSEMNILKYRWGDAYFFTDNYNTAVEDFVKLYTDHLKEALKSAEKQTLRIKSDLESIKNLPEEKRFL